MLPLATFSLDPLVSRSFHASPLATDSSMPSMVSGEPPLPPSYPVPSSHPSNFPPQIYIKPILSLPPSPVHPYTSNVPNLVYPTAPLPHKMPTYSTRSVTRHHLYHKKGLAATSTDHPDQPSLDNIYPSPLSEISKTSGQKQMAVSEISDLFPLPSKKFASVGSYEDQMMKAAQSLSALMESPPAPTTPIFHTSPLVTHSTFAESSPTARNDSRDLSTVPMSPTLGKKVYKAGKKSRSVTQLILMDAGSPPGTSTSHAGASISHAGATTSAQVEVAGLAMPPPDI